MTHAHDRTLLARLGFGDPDARSSQHDLACLYVGSPERAEALARLVYKEFEAGGETTACYEHPISKGQGQYKTTIGFVDVIIKVWVAGIVTIDGVEQEKREWMQLGWIGVEVKIARESASNCLRQIELYRSYLPDVGPWVLVSPWDVSESEAEMLTSSSIRHVKLGPGFEEFCQRPQQAAVSPTL